METYYVTGATGHLGRNFIIALLEGNPKAQVVALVLPKDKKRDFPPSIASRIFFVEGNILEPKDLDAFFSTWRGEENFLLHSAGLITIFKKKAPHIMEVNYEGTRLIAQKALEHKINKMVYVASVDAFKKEKKGPIYEPLHFNPSELNDIYGRSKAMACHALLDEFLPRGLNVVIVMPSALMGPNDYFAGPINSALSLFYHGHLPGIVTGGYDLVDARDVALGIVAAFDKGWNGECYLLTGHSSSVKDLIAVARKLTGKKGGKLVVPANMMKIFAPFMILHAKIHHQKALFTPYSMECLSSNHDYQPTKAKMELGYSSRPLEDSVKDTLEWIKYRDTFEIKN